MPERKESLVRCKQRLFNVFGQWGVKDYICYGEENALNGQWMKQLENASARYRVSRLEALKLHTQQSLEVMFGNQLDSPDSTMKGIYTDGYYHTAFEIQKGVGVGRDFATLDEKKIQKVISKPWAPDGKNFSERVWGNRQKLVNEQNTELTRNIMLGQDPRKAIDAIARKMNTSKYNAGRLVMTEEAFFNSAARQDCFKELDVEQYEILVSYDEKTCDICQKMEGKHFMRSQWEAGVTAPPFHVNCRCDQIPYFDDEFSAMGTKAARNEEGKTIFIPANMTYEEWKDSFVDGGVKSDMQGNFRLNESEKGAIIKYVSPDSIVLNDKLRRGEVLTAEEKEWVKNLNSALEKLPCYKGDLNRSLTFEFEEDAKNFMIALL